MKNELNEGVERTIELSHFGITIELDGEGGGTISTPLTEGRPSDWEGDPFHMAVDTVLSLALYHALSGVDVANELYSKGVEAALVEISNKYGED
jgi:hypothetical protein